MNHIRYIQPILSALPKVLLAVGLAHVAACGGGGDGGDPGTTPPGNQCTPGTSTGCPAGQICSATGVCESAGVLGAMTINAPSARSCEALLESTQAKVNGATFGTGVSGAFRARPPRYAVAVARATNSPFAADSIRLTIDGSPTDVTVKQIDCYDASGAAVSGASAAIQ